MTEIRKKNGMTGERTFRFVQDTRDRESFLRLKINCLSCINLQRELYSLPGPAVRRLKGTMPLKVQWIYVLKDLAVYL